MKAMKTMMRITDNQHKIIKEKFVEEYPKLSNLLLDRTLESLSQDERIFIFPNDLTHTPDLDKKQKILETINQEIKTGNQDRKCDWFSWIWSGKINDFLTIF